MEDLFPGVGIGIFVGLLLRYHSRTSFSSGEERVGALKVKCMLAGKGGSFQSLPLPQHLRSRDSWATQPNQSSFLNVSFDRTLLS